MLSPSLHPRPPLSSTTAAATGGRTMSAVGSGIGNYHHGPTPFPQPYHLMEMTVVSAQDLHPATRSMRTYAVAWITPEHRFRTRVDSDGHTYPTWNDKFVFRIDDETLRSDTTAVNIDIYAARGRFLPTSPTLIGTARAILSALNPTPVTRFVALQVRRPTSLRPQGMVNLGISLLNTQARSMPLLAGSRAASPALSIVPKDVTEQKLEKRGSVRAGNQEEDREKSALEAQLEKWRAELPAINDRDNKVGKKPVASVRVTKRQRSFGSRLACFTGPDVNPEGGGLAKS